MSHEIARLLREISYELIAIVVPGMVCGAGVLLLLHHVNIDLGPLGALVKDQPWLLSMVGLATAYALGQAVQALCSGARVLDESSEQSATSLQIGPLFPGRTINRIAIDL